MNTPINVLKQKFGYDSFRLNQEEAISRAMDGLNSLIIMPTGGGKSICYQVPALLKDGVTVVISPLIALMDDQVRSLQENGIGAVAIHGHSQQNATEIAALIEEGSLKVLYLSPEKANSERFISFIQRFKIALIAIDEAHCVSVWGNDFRPDYRRLQGMLKLFPDVPVMALTATADAATRQDIVAQLDLPNCETLISSFERKNIHISIAPGLERAKFIRNFINKRPGQSGIIYCLSRKSTEKVAAGLEKKGIKCSYYHAGMDAQRRAEVQEQFLNDEIQVICATIAFGMGIDKPNIRWVIHYNMPKNLESYYQEIGRGGRDGLDAEACLLFSYNDAAVYREFIEKSDADDHFKQLQLQKLQRMLEFCQSKNCRTQTLLSYFNEPKSEGCGHCDVCENPPTLFDGTRLAQIALSAIVRLKENVGMSLAIDVIRGSAKQEVMEHGYQHIKTFGAGRDLPWLEWRDYITQLVNQGLVMIDLMDNQKLKLTALAKPILFENQSVMLHKFSMEKKEAKPEVKSSKALFEEELSEKLRQKRKALAAERGVAPFHIFSDKTLKALLEEKPISISALHDIYGMGEYKTNEFGTEIIQTITEHLAYSENAGKVKGKTYIETLNLLNDGKSPEEVAQERGLNPGTIYSHIAYLIEKGVELDTSVYITDEQIKEIVIKWEEIGSPDELKPLFEAFQETIPYHILRLGLAIGASSVAEG